MYNMIANGVSPEQFGATGGGGAAGLLGMFGLFNRSVTGALDMGMKTGSALTNYGMQQRVAPFAEKNLMSALRNNTAQNEGNLIANTARTADEFCQANPGDPRCLARADAMANGGLRRMGDGAAYSDAALAARAALGMDVMPENYTDTTDYAANNAAMANAW